MVISLYRKIVTIDEPTLKPGIWVGSSRRDLREFPATVQDHMGYALYVAQRGGKHRDTEPLMEAIDVLHAFGRNPRRAAKRRAGTSS
jgi:hypothetical protein